MKECDKRNSHISSKFHMICISNNGRHLLIMVDTLLIMVDSFRANWGRRLRRQERWLSYQDLNT